MLRRFWPKRNPQSPSFSIVFISAQTHFLLIIANDSMVEIDLILSKSAAFFFYYYLEKNPSSLPGRGWAGSYTGALSV